MRFTPSRAHFEPSPRPAHPRTEILPGLVETEFSLVRFKNDVDQAAKPYEGIVPLTAEDIADCISWAATRPPHVNIDEIVVKPRAQATATLIAREERG